VAELDDFLARWVTAILSARGYKKSRHTYRKQFTNSDWSVLSFRGYPTGILGSFLVDASFVPSPMWDWFRFRSPNLAGKAPTGWWSDWSAPLAPDDFPVWRYETIEQRDHVGALLGERLARVVDQYDWFGTDPDALLDLALDPERAASDTTPLGRWHLRHDSKYLACLLIRRGWSPELERELEWSDGFPALRLREWAEQYLANL
jgi:hypothetical protein